MSKEELEKDYYKDRPTEPYCTDEMPNDWAELAHYAEYNLEKAFKHIEQLEKENAVFKKALHLYIDWADECDIAWDNFPDMKEKWWKVVEEKGLGWIDGLMFMVIEEAKEQFSKEEHNDERPV